MNNNEPKREKKHIFRRKAVRVAKGSISILLCLLIIPFLSIGIELMEYMRYQQAIEQTRELHELAVSSALTQYDVYLLDRFGLMATTQDADYGKEHELLFDNIHILGNQVELATATMEGKLSLEDVEILKQQIIEVSELTVPLKVLMEDLNLQQFIQRFGALENVQNMLNTVDQVSSLADAVTKTVNAIDTLKTTINTLITSIGTLKTKAETAASKFADLYKNIIDGSIDLPENITPEALVEYAENGTFVGKLKAAYQAAKDFMDYVSTVKSNATAVKNDADALIRAFGEAKDAADAMTAQPSADPKKPGNVTEAVGNSGSAFDSILDDLSGVVEDTVQDLKDSVESAVNEAINKVYTDIKNQLGIEEVRDRYTAIANGTYFADADSETEGLQLSEQAAADLKELLEDAKDIAVMYVRDGTLDFNGMLEKIKGWFIPKININLSDIVTSLETAAKTAWEKIQDDAENGLISMLKKLVSIISGLFKLTVFYDSNLDAYVSLNASLGTSSYQDFLNAFNEMDQAIKNYNASTEDGNIIEKLKAAITAVANIISAGVKMGKAIITIITEKFTGLFSFFSDGLGGIYERLVITGYMCHNLPSRVSAGTIKPDGMIELTGTGITGFNYDDIPRPQSSAGENIDKLPTLSMDNMASALGNEGSKRGSDKMFRGAELEFIYAGTASEVANQVAVFLDLYFFRLIIGLPAVFTDPAVGTLAAGTTIGAPIVYILYMLIEPFLDTMLLVNGGDIPLIKQKCWATATGFGTFVKALGEVTIRNPRLKEEFDENLKGSFEGLGDGVDANKSNPAFSCGWMETGYNVHTMILMIVFLEEDKQISRFRNLIELEAKAYYGKADDGTERFKLSNANTVVRLELETKFNSFISLNDFVFPQVKLVQEVGY